MAQDQITIVEQVDQIIIDETPPDNVILISPVAIGTGGGGSGGVTPLAVKHKTVLIANLPAGGTQVEDGDLIANTVTGRLWGVSIGSAVPLRCDIEIVTGSSPLRTVIDTVYTEWGEQKLWTPPDPRWFQRLSDGTLKYGVTVFNLDPIDTSDVRLTIYWDQDS